jgi:hypothetical protein
MFRHRTAALAVIVIAALWLAPFGATGQSKKKSRAKSRKTSANANVVPAPTPSIPVAPPEPEPVKKNEREAAPVVAPTPAPAATKQRDAPRYSWEFTQPNFTTSRILIEHDGNGKGTITFVRKATPDPISDPIEISAAAWSRIRAHWDALNFLDSTTDYQSERQYPHMGTVTIKLQIGAHQRSAAFNWTNDKEAGALSDEYRKISDQAMWVFDIKYAQEIEPLSAPDVMRRLESMLDRKQLSDPTQLVPLLQDLSVDERVPLIARNHAARLLKKIQK